MHHEAVVRHAQVQLHDPSRKLDAFPERLVWGSDWPHVTEREKPDDAELMDLVAEWLAGTGWPRVLVDNPAQLYRFDVLPGA